MNADHNLTIEQMLSKYANENSEDDSDFVPNAEDENTTSDTSSESESESHSSEHSSSNEEQENTEQVDSIRLHIDRAFSNSLSLCPSLQHKENIKPTNNTSNHVQKPKEPQATLNGNEREPMEVGNGY